MPRVENVTEIDSPPSTVWRVLTDSSYIPKLYSNIITVEMNPPGRVVRGQKGRLLGKVGPVTIEMLIEFTRVETESCLASRTFPGGVFRSFEQIVTLTPMGFRTTVKARFDYVLSPEFAKKVPDVALLERLVIDDLRAYSRNLKDICELLSLAE
jgi:hypothetical protein